MTEFAKFKQKMLKIGATFVPRASGRNASFTLDKYISIQVTSHPEQHDTGLVAVSLALRKDGGFYFPLGQTWSMNNCRLVEQIEAILLEYNIHVALVLRTCW